jgi:hypothetical protein
MENVQEVCNFNSMSNLSSFKAEYNSLVVLNELTWQSMYDSRFNNVYLLRNDRS